MPRLCLLALALSALQTGQLLTLEIRVFRGSEDVTGHSRVVVHRAGERGQPVGHLSGSTASMKVAPGIYDAQAVQEQDSRVVNIRWAERLVVMPYPDEDGHHLEVINVIPGYGALQIRTNSENSPIDGVALFPAQEREPADRRRTLARQQHAVRGARGLVRRPGPTPLLEPSGTPTSRSRSTVPACGSFPESRQDASNDTPAAQQPEHDHHQRDHQQDVNESARDLEGEAEDPEQQQYGNECPQHR